MNTIISPFSYVCHFDRTSVESKWPFLTLAYHKSSFNSRPSASHSLFSCSIFISSASDAQSHLNIHSAVFKHHVSKLFIFVIWISEALLSTANETSNESNNIRDCRIVYLLMVAITAVTISLASCFWSIATLYKGIALISFDLKLWNRSKQFPVHELSQWKQWRTRLTFPTLESRCLLEQQENSSKRRTLSYSFKNPKANTIGVKIYWTCHQCLLGSGGWIRINEKIDPFRIFWRTITTKRYVCSFFNHLWKHFYMPIPF